MGLSFTNRLSDPEIKDQKQRFVFLPLGNKNNLYNNQINASALIGQSAISYCAGKPTENRASPELLYLSNIPQVCMGYKLINLAGCW